MTWTAYGFFNRSHSDRVGGGYMRTFQLVDLLTAWDLTLNNIIPTGHTTENPSTTFTLSDALDWMIHGDGTAEYPGVADPDGKRSLYRHYAYD